MFLVVSRMFSTGKSDGSVCTVKKVAAEDTLKPYQNAKINFVCIIFRSEHKYLLFCCQFITSVKSDLLVMSVPLRDLKITYNFADYANLLRNRGHYLCYKCYPYF